MLGRQLLNFLRYFCQDFELNHESRSPHSNQTNIHKSHQILPFESTKKNHPVSTLYKTVLTRHLKSKMSEHESYIADKLLALRRYHQGTMFCNRATCNVLLEYNIITGGYDRQKLYNFILPIDNFTVLADN